MDLVHVVGFADLRLEDESALVANHLQLVFFVRANTKVA